MPDLYAIRKFTLSKVEGLNAKRGFSLVEIVIAVFLIAVISIILIPAANTLLTRKRTDLSAIAGKVASREIEVVRSLDFGAIGNLSNQTCGSEFDQPSSSTYLPNCRIDRTVSCYPSTYPLPCTPDPNVKQVSITVQWKFQGQLKTVVMETLISPGGLSGT